jgi:hypothetical protein
VVTGYRVAEYVSQGKYWVVREKNAHAWVEVWVEEKGWVTRDPTPPDGVPQDRRREASLTSALWDLGKLKSAEIQTWLSDRTIGQTALAMVVGFAALVWMVVRGMRRPNAGPRTRGEYTPPLPCFDRLLAELKRRGVVRHPSESLDRFAARLPRTAAALVRRYAALRYGNDGEERAIAEKIDEFIRAGGAADEGAEAMR